MPRINSFIKLIKYVSSLMLIFLGVVFINNYGVTQMLFGNIANQYIYPFAEIAIQWLAFIFVWTIPILIILGIISYFRNRGKSDKPSPELQAIDKLIKSIDALVNEIQAERENRNGKQQP